MHQPPAGGAPASRIATLDLVRGVAVLGIVAINVGGFAGTLDTTDTPALPAGAHGLDAAVFAGAFVVFEGKMRALFSMLFGASMLLFLERAEAAGRPAHALQLRRLGWLGLFGYAHYLLLWWGDILFLYALCGALALVLSPLPARAQAVLGVMGFGLWHVWGMLGSLPDLLTVEALRAHTATLAQQHDAALTLAAAQGRVAQDLAAARLGFWGLAAHKLAVAPFWPLTVTLYTVGETLPLMLIGMALYRSGFWQGRWPRAAVAGLLAGALVVGGALCGALLAWSWSRGFPVQAMGAVLAYWAGPEHLALGLAYGCALVLAAPRLLATALGRRLVAAGRMAFSNYLGTSLLLAFVCNGWGLGLVGQISRAAQLGLAGAIWAVMLVWSPLWLAHFRQGPLEWLWRSLTEGRALPLRRVSPS